MMIAQRSEFAITYTRVDSTRNALDRYAIEIFTGRCGRGWWCGWCNVKAFVGEDSVISGRTMILPPPPAPCYARGRGMDRSESKAETCPRG